MLHHNTLHNIPKLKGEFAKEQGTSKETSSLARCYYSFTVETLSICVRGPLPAVNPPCFGDYEGEVVLLLFSPFMSYFFLSRTSC